MRRNSMPHADARRWAWTSYGMQLVGHRNVEPESNGTRHSRESVLELEAYLVSQSR